MTTKLITIALIWIAASCGQQATHSSEDNMNSSSKKLLQGSWFGKEYDEHAVFRIDGDSINFVEHFDKLKYRLSKDTFEIVTRESHTKQVIIRLTKDSLIVKDAVSGLVSKYWKMKP